MDPQGSVLDVLGRSDDVMHTFTPLARRRSFRPRGISFQVSRTALIWVVELALMWNTFSWMQLVGFVVLVAGTLVYNELIIIPGIEPDKGTRRALWIEGFLAAIHVVISVVVGCLWCLAPWYR